VRDEDKENLFRALNDVKNLMQQDDGASPAARREPKFTAKDDEDVLELAGHEIHDFQEPEYSLQNLADELILEEITLDSGDEQAIDPDSKIEASQPEHNNDLSLDEVSSTSQNAIRHIFEQAENKKSSKAEQSVDIAEIIHQTAKPYIIKWLDDHLESVVRGVVELEIAKIMKKAKK